MAARALVAYATKLGSTAEIAEAIASVLGDAGHHAEAVPVQEITTLDGWDAVVLGSALYAAHWRKEARRFVIRFHDGLAARPLWLFSSGPLDVVLARLDLPMAANVAEVTEGLGARGHRTFGGRLASTAPVDPQILATHPIGDFRDWAAIRRWAEQIARALHDEPAPPPADA